MVLIIEYYEPTNINRKKEYDWCIEKNIESKLFEEIHVFIETGSMLPLRLRKSNRVKIHVETRKTFQDLFNFCNTHLMDKICIISNTDIYFDSSINEVTEDNILNKFIALTRWDLLSNGQLRFFNNQQGIAHFSQDTWIFKSPIPIDNADFFMGKPGCDNKIVYLAHNHGMQTVNPSLKIITRHLHLTQYRTYIPGGPETVPGPWMGLEPTNDVNDISKKRMLLG